MSDETQLEALLGELREAAGHARETEIWQQRARAAGTLSQALSRAVEVIRALHEDNERLSAIATELGERVEALQVELSAAEADGAAMVTTTERLADERDRLFTALQAANQVIATLERDGTLFPG